ncbi:MAG: TorF family putative porin [Candidatus Didemnitutus sp.]|nr:TorF family putative porin [Candidatus Didemnitutus sp.]
MKKIFLSALALVAAASLRAEDLVPSFSVTADFTFASEYVFRGVKQQSASFQPSIGLEAGAFSAGLWTAQAVEQRTGSWAQGNEIDLFAGYALVLAKDYELTFGATAYLYPSARPSLGELDSTFETSVGFSGPVGPLAGSAAYFHDFDLKGDIFELGVSYGVELGESVSYEFAATYGLARYDAGGDYDYTGLSASLAYQLTGTAKLKLGVHWADTDLTGLKSNTWFSIGITAGL